MHAAKTSPVHSDAAVSTETLPGMEYWCAPTVATPVANALTIDLEDWPIAVLGPHHEVTGRVVENTLRCLQILRWHNVRATFFVLGKVALKYPDLIREVHAAGHEIASHGHGHELLTTLTPRQFEDDVRRSVDILGGLVGERPLGYRAPGFSIVESTRWAGPILAELGFKYSSSIFPIRHRRYGIPGAPRRIHRWDSCGLIECPPATYPCLGWNIPMAGGGYFRLLPGALARFAVRRINRTRMPAILYMHPYELDVDGIGEHRLAGVRVGWGRRITQSLFRERMEGRLHRLLESMRFTTMRDVLQHNI
jgi:polysaccharide deacetylase family protein (PEP-CTERM system associated)